MSQYLSQYRVTEKGIKLERPPAVYTQTPSSYGLADLVKGRKLVNHRRDTNGINSTYRFS